MLFHSPNACKSQGCHAEVRFSCLSRHLFESSPARFKCALRGSWISKWSLKLNPDTPVWDIGFTRVSLPLHQTLALLRKMLIFRKYFQLLVVEVFVLFENKIRNYKLFLSEMTANIPPFFFFCIRFSRSLVVNEG